MPFMKARLGSLLLLFGLAAAAPAAKVGDLPVSEVMSSPAAVSDSRGGLFEHYGPDDEAINPFGTNLDEDGGDRHRIETDLLILPELFLVLGRNGNAAQYGGFESDYFCRDFTRSNGADEITRSNASTEWGLSDASGSDSQRNHSPAVRILA